MVGFVLIHQSFSSLFYLLSDKQIKKCKFGELSSTIHEIELAVKELPESQIAYKMNKYLSVEK
jgi:hypothetical protein